MESDLGRSGDRCVNTISHLFSSWFCCLILIFIILFGDVNGYTRNNWLDFNHPCSNSLCYCMVVVGMGSCRIFHDLL